MTQHPQQTMYRQGDLLFVRQSTLPTDAQQRAGTILVEGETTGHAHRLRTTSQGAILQTPDGQLWLDVTAEMAQIVHEEHDTVTLDQGVWQVIRQREYSPEAIRTVVD